MYVIPGALCFSDALLDLATKARKIGYPFQRVRILVGSSEIVVEEGLRSCDWSAHVLRQRGLDCRYQNIQSYQPKS